MIKQATIYENILTEIHNGIVNNIRELIQQTKFDIWSFGLGNHAIQFGEAGDEDRPINIISSVGLDRVYISDWSGEAVDEVRLVDVPIETLVQVLREMETI